MAIGVHARHPPLDGALKRGAAIGWTRWMVGIDGEVRPRRACKDGATDLWSRSQDGVVSGLAVPVLAVKVAAAATLGQPLRA